MNAGIAAARRQRSHINAVFEVGTATMMSATGAIKAGLPAVKGAGERSIAKAYLPAIHRLLPTPRRTMLSFPFQFLTMVRWINKDELKRPALLRFPKTCRKVRTPRRS